MPMACAMVKHFGVGVVTRPEVTLATPVAPFAAADSLRSRSASSTVCGASLAVAWQSSMLMSEMTRPLLGILSVIGAPAGAALAVSGLPLPLSPTDEQPASTISARQAAAEAANFISSSSPASGCPGLGLFRFAAGLGPFLGRGREGEHRALDPDLELHLGHPC